MITSLYIENIALIKKMNIALSSGFTVLTGETGGGKSIILDSISLLCGARNDKDIIRTGESFALVEGVFDISSLKIRHILEEEGITPDDDGFYYISRRITSDGRSVCKIGGRNVPVSRLRLVGSYLINIHGQQDTQTLTDTGNHLSILDTFAHTAPLLERYSTAYSAYKSADKALNELLSAKSEKNEREEILKYKIRELNAARLKKGEYQKLTDESNRLKNAEKIEEYTKSAYSALYSAPSAYDSVKLAAASLKHLENAVPDITSLAERLESCAIEISDIAETLGSYSSMTGDNITARLDAAEAKLMLYQRLSKKYSTDPDSLCDYLDELKAKEEENGNIDFYINEKQKLLALKESELAAIAAELTEFRVASAKRLCTAICEKLAYLDMPSVIFHCDVKPKSYQADGADKVEFLVSANVGETPKPMAKIASGGELSRIMLSIKSVLASDFGAETLVFDEIDTGISGKTSEKIGLMLKELSNKENVQLLCVTHSAQIAALAHAHLKVSKRTANNRTDTIVTPLDFEMRVQEVARIMGGINITEHIQSAARETVSKAYK